MVLQDMTNTMARKTDHETHNRYYHETLKCAEDKILSFFETRGIDLGEIIHRTKIENADDVETILAFVLSESNDQMEHAHMIRWVTTWLHAHNELMEYREEH